MLIAILGASYVAECLDVLAAPGVPVEMRYKARGGTEVSLRAESYNFAWRQGYLGLSRPRMVAEDGSTVAQLESLSLDGLNVLWGSDQVIDARAHNLQARMVRLRDGRFELQDLLPERREERSRLPFRFRLDEARVLFIDRSSPREWRKPVLVTDLHVEGMGDDWIATAGAYATGVGRVTGRIQSIFERGIAVSGRTDGLELAPVFAHLKATPDRRVLGELQTATVESFHVSGPFAVFLPTEGELSVESNVKARVENAQFQRYHADLATFEGFVSRNGMKGKVTLVEGPSRGAFAGSAVLGKGYRLGGNLRVSTPSVERLPLWVRELIPAQVRFQDGVYEGWVTVVDGKATADGTLSAEWMRVAKEEIVDPLVRIHFDPQSTMLRLVRGQYLGRNASGVLVYNFQTRALNGAVSSTYTTLEPLVARFPQLRGLSGTATLSMSLAGTTDRPTMDFEARGSAVYRRPGMQPVIVDRYDLTGTYRNGLVAVTRGTLQGPAGLVTVLGNATEAGGLDLRLVGRDLNLSFLDRRLAGSSNVTAEVAGTMQNPQATGRIELYNAEVEGQAITAAAADFTANRRRAVLQNLNAYRGAANVTGTLEYRLANQGIAGRLSARNVQLEDFFGAGYAGSLSSPSLVLSGTVSRPVVRGQVNARDVIVQGIKIESATAQASLLGAQANIAEGTVNVAGGTVKVSGGIDTRTRRGRFVATASGLDVNRLAPTLARYATVNGSLDGTTTIDVAGANVVAANGAGRLNSIVFNETPIGDGPWTLRYDGTRVTGALDVGFLDRFVSLSDLSYVPGTGAIEGRADLFSLRLQDLVGAALPSIPELPYDTEQRLRAITGVVNLGSTFSGTTDQPRLDIERLEATDLEYRNTDFGALTASISMSEGQWSIRNLALAGPVGTAQISGTADEAGPIDITGELSGFDLLALSVIEPKLAQMGGQIDLSFEVRGQTQSPFVRASLRGNRLFAKSEDAPDDETLRLLLDTIEISEADGLQLGGNYFYRGFQGTITASAPVEYPFAIGGDGQVQTRVTLARRDLKEIASLIQGIDADRTTGFVEGEVRGSGTLDNFVLNGSINLEAETLAFAGGRTTGDIDTVLEKVVAEVAIGQNRVAINVSGDSARGGTFTAEASTNIEDFRQLAENVGIGGTRALLDNPIGGNIVFEAFHGRESFAGNAYVDAVLDGTVQLGGTVQNPRISGELSASSVDTVLPFFEATNQPGRDLLLNPAFDLRFALSDPARVRTATADIYMDGEGSLTGSLAQPNLHATMLVDRGSIRFPASTVRLDEGGQIELRYRVSAGEPFASLEVDLQGKTAVTALRYDDVPERYEILLELTGDLLKEGGLNLVATSDPPDLTQERILTLLGSVDLLTAFISSDAQYGTEERFRGALIGYALPVVFDPFTSRVAAALGLEYLNLEYNQYEQASIAFAKALTPELILQGRRQVSAPAPGFTEQYDLRLVYRPRRLKGALRRFSLSVGTDQDRPWKIALEYGTRF